LATDDFLIAHIVPDSSIEIAENLIPLWRKTLASQLPSHLVPYDFNLLGKMPTTLNDKIDRKALLQYKKNKKINYTEPRTEEEKIVASIWKKSLNIDKIDVFSTFFEMGGHSIKAVTVMTEIEKHSGKRFPLSVLFEYSTVEKFAKLLNTSSEIYSDCLVPIKSNGTKVPLFMVHGGGLNVLNYVNLSKYFDEDQPFYDIQGIGSKGFDNWYESIEDMATHYIDAIVKVNPKGPYALAGYCVGGIVVFEMIRQLKEQGKEVSLTILLDSHIDPSYYYKTYKQKKLVRYYVRTHKRLVFLKEMLLNWKAFKMRINAKKEYLLKKHFDKDNSMSEEDALALKQFTEAVSMIQTILDRYHLKPQNINVDLFRSKDHVAHIAAPTHVGWKKAALKGVTVHNIPVDNFDIRLAENDKILARMFQDILDKRHANT
jgi:thioesterase domain-containing protein/acyl carrier protein